MNEKLQAQINKLWKQKVAEGIETGDIDLDEYELEGIDPFEYPTGHTIKPLYQMRDEVLKELSHESFTYNKDLSQLQQQHYRRIPYRLPKWVYKSLLIGEWTRAESKRVKKHWLYDRQIRGYVDDMAFPALMKAVKSRLPQVLAYLIDKRTTIKQSRDIRKQWGLKKFYHVSKKKMYWPRYVQLDFENMSNELGIGKRACQEWCSKLKNTRIIRATGTGERSKKGQPLTYEIGYISFTGNKNHPIGSHYYFALPGLRKIMSDKFEQFTLR